MIEKIGPTVYKGGIIYNIGGGGGGGGSVIINYTDLEAKEMPDGRIWTTKNLDLVCYGTNFGAVNQDTDMQTCAMLESETYTPTFGLTYNAQVVDYIHTNKDIICPGWDVPAKSELETLLAACGGDNAGLKAAGFNPLDGARVYRNGQWETATSGTYFWSRSNWHSGFNFALYTRYSGGVSLVREEYRRELFYIRLIKDL